MLLCCVRAGQTTLLNCNRTFIDLVLVLDGSQSVEASNFELVRQFASSIVDSMTIGPNASRYASCCAICVW